MQETPTGTPVGVDDPYAHADACDHLTDDGRCRLAAERPGQDPGFAAARRADDLRCPAADPDGEWTWADCPHFRATTDGRECARCGLAERRDAHSDARPLLEAHHLVYPDDDRECAHEVTVALCRWCHAKVHKSWARVGDDVAPDPEAVAAREGRVSEEAAELSFETAAERFDVDGDESAED
ncbi:MAG: hypothetical protein ABEJ42_10485 [Halobacteriaceae archaeon]